MYLKSTLSGLSNIIQVVMVSACEIFIMDYILNVKKASVKLLNPDVLIES